MDDMSHLNKNRGGIVQLKLYEEMLVTYKRGTTRHNEPLQAVIENKMHESALTETNSNVLERNRALLQYIATLANSNSNTDEFNYEFVGSLLSGGADINIADDCDQTMFHEVARSWNIDVARFLLENGCDVNKRDSYGRTPLHVASAVDYATMVEFLLQNNANIDARTNLDGQAPIHFAAKNGAIRSLKMLLGFEANIDSVDSKNRTPLQLAAEWTRFETAKVLLDEGAAAASILDSCGNSSLCVLIDRIPHLALDALSQLHSRDIITMKDYYFLHHLEKSKENPMTKSTRTALETAVATKKYEVVTHPVMQRLIHNKWTMFGRLSNIFDLLFHVVFWLMWTATSLGTPSRGADLYTSEIGNLWRLVIGALVLLMTTYQIWGLVYGTYRSRKSQQQWVSWRLEQLQHDMSCCHPRWPQEEKYVKREIKRVKSLPTFNVPDAWFYFDWVILAAILITIGAHFAFYSLDTYTSRRVYVHTISVVNLFVGLRILKHVRPFPGIGTLVIILGETSGDIINWAFLFLLLLIPFSAAFWINFGSVSEHQVFGFRTTAQLLYSVFKMSVGDEFHLDGMVEADPVMARILVVLTLTIFTIITLNLLIALLTDTFSRVHGNAIANTVMQRAIKTIEAERTIPKWMKRKYKDFMATNCSPEVLPMSIDEYVPENDSERARNQMHSDVRTAHATLQERFSKAYGKDNESDFDAILNGVKKLKEHESEYTNDILQVKDLLNSLSGGKSRKSQRMLSWSPSTESRPRSKRASVGAGSSILDFFRQFSIQDKDKEDAGRNKRSAKERRAGKRDHKRRRNAKRDGEENRPHSQRHMDSSSETSIVPYGVEPHRPQLASIAETSKVSGTENKGLTFDKEDHSDYEL